VSSAEVLLHCRCGWSRNALTDRRVAVVVPALNEAQSIGALVRSMPWHLIRECVVLGTIPSLNEELELGSYFVSA
jgi:protein-tyrosine phosphatase